VDTFSFRIGESVERLSSLLRTRLYAQLFDLIMDRNQLDVYVMRLRTPPSSLALNEDLLAIAQERGLPSDLFRERANDARDAIERNERTGRKTEELRRRYEGNRVAVIAPREDEWTINVHINTREGHAYGVMPVNVTPSGQLDQIRQQIIANYGHFFPLPQQEEQWKYVYAGRMYSRQTPFETLPRIRNGDGIFVSFF
jgi:hypothetical protein